MSHTPGSDWPSQLAELPPHEWADALKGKAMGERLERYLRIFAKNIAAEVAGLEGTDAAAVRLMNSILLDSADEMARLRSDRADLLEALQGFMQILDGQTEPLHPVSWLTAVEAARAAIRQATVEGA
jgi:hypothetical protein